MLSVICVTTGELVHPELVMYNQRLVRFGKLPRPNLLDFFSPRRRAIRHMLETVLTPAPKPLAVIGKYHCPECQRASLVKQKKALTLLPNKKTGIPFVCSRCSLEYLLVINTRRQG